LRNLTITRRKSFVGCAMKDQVYIHDEAAPELIIEGVPCRKIGTVKNGETKTFQIEDREQQVFVIVDKVSKNYCNASIAIPAGQEDVSLSGIHKFYYGSNPFVFDGVELTEEQQAKQKKNRRKGVVITILAAIVGLIIGYGVSNLLLNHKNASPKTFTKGDFQITLTSAFEAAEHDDFFASYESKSVLVLVVKEDKSLFDDITLEEYGALAQEVNGRDGLKLHKEEDFIYFDYTATGNDEETYYYCAVCCESEDAFWIVNFATPVSNQEKYQKTFLKWASSIEVD